MKIAPRAAEACLSNPTPHGRALLLYGPDSGLARERALRVKKALLGGNDDPFAFTEFEEASLLSDKARLADELQAISFLGGKRVIMVRDAGDKLAGVIKDCAPYLNDEVFLLLVAGELTTRSPLRTWFDTEPGVAALACYRDEMRDVADIVSKSFAAAGIEASRDVLDYLAGQLGNDRYVTRQELEKLAIYAGDNKKISLEEAQSLVDYNREANLDDIVQAVADRNLAALEKTLQVQLREGVQPVAYLRSLQRYFNRLYFIAAQVNAGQNLDSVIANLKPKVFFRAEQSLRRHANSWGLEALAKALRLLVAAELASKSSDIPVTAATSRRLMQITQLR